MPPNLLRRPRPSEQPLEVPAQGRVGLVENCRECFVAPAHRVRLTRKTRGAAEKLRDHVCKRRRAIGTERLRDTVSEHVRWHLRRDLFEVLLGRCGARGVLLQDVLQPHDSLQGW